MNNFNLRRIYWLFFVDMIYFLIINVIFFVWIIDYGSVYLCNSVECIWIIIYKIFIDICVLGRCLDNKDIDMSWNLMIKM